MSDDREAAAHVADAHVVEEHLDVRGQLDPELQPLFGEIQPVPASLDELIARIRPEMAGYAEFFAQSPVRDGIERSKLFVQTSSESNDHAVPVHVHRTVVRPAEPAAAYIWLHGGGYIAGSPLQDVVGLDMVAHDTGCVALGVDYRKAPEHPFPAALDDALAVLLYVIEHSVHLGIDPDRIAVGGSSAGAGLAAALNLLARDRGVKLLYQHLLYPMLDDRQITPSSQWTVPLWSHETNTLGWKAYLGDLYGTDSVPAYAAPARAADLHGLPSTFMHVGMLDGFLHENLEYVARLSAAGVPTEFHLYPGAPHAFDALGGSVDVSKRANEVARHALIRALA